MSLFRDGVEEYRRCLAYKTHKRGNANCKRLLRNHKFNTVIEKAIIM